MQADNAFAQRKYPGAIRGRSGHRLLFTFLALPDPFLEGGGVLLADDDLFVNGQGQFHADLAFFEGFETFDVIGVYYIFPVCAVEEVFVQFVFQLTQVTLFGHIFPVFFIDEEDKLVFGEKVSGVFDTYGLEFGAFADQDAGAFAVRPGNEIGQGVMMVVVEVVVHELVAAVVIAAVVIGYADEMGLKGLVFLDGVAETILANRF